MIKPSISIINARNIFTFSTQIFTKPTIFTTKNVSTFKFFESSVKKSDTTTQFTFYRSKILTTFIAI